MGLLDDLLKGVLSGGASEERDARLSQGSAGIGGGGGGTMMALLPVVLSMFASRAGAGGGGFGNILGEVLGGDARSGAGGLGGLLEQMERASFGDQGRSWIGTGRNMPISPDGIGQIFGRDGVEEIARRAGLTPQQTSEGLSQLLPEVVDHVTPGGCEPDFDQLTRSVDDLRQRMGA